MELLNKVWPQWKVVGELGEGSFGKVYEIERKDVGGTYKAALKIITIPKSQGEIDDVMSEGMDVQSVTEYFHGMMEEIVKEFAMMEKLKGNTNIVSYEDHEVVPREDGIGWDILIRMELLTPLTKYMKKAGMEEADVIRLGIDMCKALELCQQYNIIHRDIKPENIFVSELGDFKLGDFGVARTVEKTMSGMSKKGTYTYMAPEVYKGEAYNATVDLYSLGVVLYRMVNDYRTPFLPPVPEDIKFSDRENALERRINGEVFPAPAHGSSGLTEIINRACAYRAQDRYENANQMHHDLERLLKGTEPETEKNCEPDDFDRTVSMPAFSSVQILTEEEEKTVAAVNVTPVVERKVEESSISEFQVDETRLAEAREELYRKQKECAACGVSKKNQLVAVLLGIFLNSYGAPYFYLGHWKKGLIRILLTFITIPLGMFLIPIGVIIEGWIYALRIGCGDVKDKKGRFVLSKSQKKAWAPTEK